MRSSTILLLAAGLVGGVTASSCTVSYSANPNHCINQDGDAFCREKYGEQRAFCVEGSCLPNLADGCSTERPEEDVCYSPCGGGKTLADDPECEGVAEDSSSSGMSGDPTSLTSTEPTSTTEPTGTTQGTSMSTGDTESSSSTSSGCTEHAECGDPSAPLCIDMACVPCTDAGATADAECEQRDSSAPACRDDGQCVQCTSTNPSACGDTTPVCDVPSNACVGCMYHEQCEATACDIATGACFDDAGCGVVEVDGDGGADYTDIASAIGEGCVVILHELDGGDDYGEFTADGVTVAILAADGEQPIVQGTGGNPSLSVTNDANVYVQGMRFSQSTAVGIDVDGANLWLDRTEVVLNSGGGIELTDSAYAQVRNSIVGANGTNNFSPTTGIRVTDSTVDVVYATLALNQGDAEDSMQCTNASGTFRNSIALGTDTMSYACVGVAATNSAFDGAVAGNTNVGALQPSWFDNVASSVFTLSATGGTVFGDIAEWQLGDPLVDIDGDPRPSVDGTADVAGADLP